MNFFDHKDLGNHLLQLCPKVVKHPVYSIPININLHVDAMAELKTTKTGEIPGTIGMPVQTCTNELGYRLTVYTLKPNRDTIPKVLVSQINFPLNIKF